MNELTRLRIDLIKVKRTLKTRVLGLKKGEYFVLFTTTTPTDVFVVKRQQKMSTYFYTTQLADNQRGEPLSAILIYSILLSGKFFIFKNLTLQQLNQTLDNYFPQTRSYQNQIIKRFKKATNG